MQNKHVCIYCNSILHWESNKLLLFSINQQQQSYTHLHNVQSFPGICHCVVVDVAVGMKCVWWRGYLLFRHRNCIREPGHLYTAHGIIGSQNLLLVHDLAPAPELHHLLFLWSPGSHLTSTASTRQGHERERVSSEKLGIAFPRKVTQMVKWE